MKDYEQTYEDRWKQHVETNGVLDPDKVKRELHDYAFLLRAANLVYYHATGGCVSKTNTKPEAVIEAINEHVSDLIMLDDPDDGPIVRK